MIRRHFLPVFVWLFYRLLTWSWRKTLVLHPQLEEHFRDKKPIVLAHWHGDELALIHLVKPFRLATMTSLSADGQIVDYVIRRFGGQTSKGSSSRGAVGALKGLIRLIKSGHTASIAVDGPRGPYRQVKPGVFELSRLAGAHIVPVGAIARPAHVFEKSWNKAFLPLPFAKVSIYFGAPWVPLTKADDAKDIQLRDRLTDQLVEAHGEALKIFAKN